MGNNVSSTLVQSTTEDKKEIKNDVQSQCPMKTATVPVSDKCPVAANKNAYKNDTLYNVYSQKIDPKNNMPASANQTPADNQAYPLPTHRELSSIPKGGTDDETWLYPSPQMFWNALVRKQKTEGVSEKDVETVISIHNNMNENTWNQVMQWEKLHPVQEVGREPKLLRFIGRPDELSPKARLKSIFGHSEPFDRHDWFVDRGGTIVRYIIDYYHDESQIQRDQRPQHLTDATSIKSIKVDVRPALDSVSAILDRVFLMPVKQVTKATDYAPPPFFPPSTMVTAEKEKTLKLNEKWGLIQSNCGTLKSKLDNCTSESECNTAAIALNKCMANVVCPQVANEFSLCITKDDTAKTTAAYSDVVKCLELFEIESRAALTKK